MFLPDSEGEFNIVFELEKSYIVVVELIDAFVPFRANIVVIVYPEVHDIFYCKQHIIRCMIVTIRIEMTGNIGNIQICRRTFTILPRPAPSSISTLMSEAFVPNGKQ